MEETEEELQLAELRQRAASRLSEGATRPTSRLSWADSEGNRRALADEETLEMPTFRSISRLSRLSESAAAEDALCETPEVDDLDHMYRASIRDLQDIKMASLFAQTLSGKEDKRKFLKDFYSYYLSRPDTDPELDENGDGRAYNPTAPPRASETWEAPQDPTPVIPSSDEASDNEPTGDGDVQLGAAPVSRGAGADEAGAARLLAELRELGPASRRDLMAQLSGMKASQRAQDGARPGEVAACGRTPEKGNRSAGGRGSSAASTSSQSSKDSPAVQRHNYFVLNLEEELESPNKLPDDRKPAFDDDDDDNSDLPAVQLNMDVDVGHGEEKVQQQGQSWDYAESVSTSSWGTEEGGVVGERRLEERGQGGGAVAASKDRKDSLAVAAQQQQLAEKDEADIAGLHEEVSKEVRRCVAKMARNALDQSGSGEMQPNVDFGDRDLEELVGLVERMLRARGKHMDRPLAVTVRGALSKFKGDNMVANCEPLVRSVANILYQELIFRKVLARMAQGFEQELRDLRSASTPPPGAAREALVAQLKARWDKDSRKLHKERRKRLGAYKERGHVQAMHSDSADDSSATSGIEEQADADSLSVAKPGASKSPPQKPAFQKPSGYDAPSSSAEDDMGSSSTGSSSFRVSFPGDTLPPYNTPSKASHEPKGSGAKKGKSQLDKGVRGPDGFVEVAIKDVPAEGEGERVAERIEFGADGVRVPEELAKMMRELAVQEQAGAKDPFVGDPEVSPDNFPVEFSSLDELPGATKARLEHLRALQQQLMAAASRLESMGGEGKGQPGSQWVEGGTRQRQSLTAGATATSGLSWT